MAKGKKSNKVKIVFIILFIAIVLCIVYFVWQLVLGLFSIQLGGVNLPANSGYDIKLRQSPSVTISVTKKPRNLNQQWNNRPHCDLNWDNKCDNQDFQLFQQSLGKCEPDYKTIDVESE
jgi:hypothetical protein